MGKDMLLQLTRCEIPTLVRAELVRRDIATRVGVSMDAVRAYERAHALHASMMPRSGEVDTLAVIGGGAVRRSESAMPSPTIPIESKQGNPTSP